VSRKLKAELGIPDMDSLREEIDALKAKIEAPMVRMVCGNCTHYKPSVTSQSWGHCTKSGKAFHAPMQRSDLDSCTSHEPVQL